MHLPFGGLVLERFREKLGIDKFKFYKFLILISTFFIYIVFHVTRKPLSIVKSILHHHNCSELYVNASVDHPNDPNWCDWPPFDTEEAKSLLGLLDTCYLTSYALFMFAAGYIAERSNLRYYLTISSIVCGIFCYLFGVAFYFKIHNLWYFIIVQILTGIAQTTAWPAIVTCVVNWFGTHKKGLVFGIWIIHGNIGNIVGDAIAGVFVETNWGLSFIVPGAIASITAIFIFLFLIPSPQDVGITQESDAEKNAKDAKVEGHSAISFLGALKIPGVVEFSIALFFGKIVFYTFLYWLPLYIAESTKSSSKESAFLSISFDVGSCFGSVIAGYVSDKSGSSTITCISMFILAIPSLFIYYLFGTASTVLNEILQFICGIFVNGPYSLIMSCVSTELGTKIVSKSAVATVTGIVVGTGSIGGAVGPALAGIISKYGWNKVFYTIMLADLMAVISLLRIGLNEFKRLRKEYSS